jgi:hypothetical protein
VRSIIVCAGILAVALLAEPAKADPTSNTLYAVFDFGGFDTGDNGYETYSESWEFESSSLLIINLADVDGVFPFISINFNGVEIDLSELDYFLIGEVDGSEHLLLSGDGEGEGFDLDPTFEQMIVDGVTNLDDVGDLGDPGGMAFISPETFESQIGTGIGTFTGPGALFDMTATVGGETDLLGFTDGIILGRITINPDGTATFIPAPEPGLALLALIGLAGTLARKRRRPPFSR